MNILYIVYNFYPEFDANSIIVNNLSQDFINQGHEVHVLTLKSYPSSIKDEFWNNIYIHRISQSYDKKQISKYFSNYKFLQGLKLLISMLRNKIRKKEYLHSFWSYYSTERIKNIMNIYNIDIIINVCYPFESCLPILKLIKLNKRNFKWIVYMQDPFASQHYYLEKYSKRDLMNFQSKVFSKADKIIVTTAIANELKKSNSQILTSKIEILNFPKVTKPHKTNINNDIIFNEEYINCVYVGKFNDDTRNPKLLLKIFGKLKNDNIRLHIIGEKKEKWKAYLFKTESNIFFYGAKSKEVAINAELNSNILINLGNSISNQLPSKILEYISTGKPIVNLYKIDDCPSLEYMIKYPIHLNILEDRTKYDEIILKIRNFCKIYKGKNIDYNLIKEKYFDCTVEYVSTEFLSICNKLIKNE